MKRVWTFFTILCMFCGEVCAVTKDQAYQIATQICGPGAYDYYIGGRVNHIFTSADNRGFPSTATLVFVDMEPTKGWQHECKYIYISTTGTLIESIDSVCPPDNIELEPYVINCNYGSLASLKPLVHHTSTKNANNNNNDIANRTYAVILNTGYNRNANNERYWNDCSFIYKVLTKRYDIAKSHIKVIMGDGTDSSPDMRLAGSRELVDSPLDLDDDGIADIEYAATPTNLLDILSDMAHTITNNDHLLLFVTGHGGYDRQRNESFLYMWENDRLYASRLATCLDQIDAQCINVVMEPCNSGGFIDEIAADGRVVATACTANESSYGMELYPYDEFICHWTEAINGYGILGNQVNADTNMDGYITMDEAFEYARNHDEYTNSHLFGHETPQLSSPIASVKEDLAFDKMPEAVDLFIRDTEYDSGRVPNNDTIHYLWESPDLYVRQHDDGEYIHKNQHIRIEDPEEGMIIYFYGIVRNRGTRPHSGNGKYLHLYMTKASGDITPEKLMRHDSSDEVTGTYLGHRKIGAIAPGDSAVYRFGYYMNCEDYDKYAVLGYMDFAILGVINDLSTEPTESLTDIGNFLYNSRTSNDIAFRNEKILPIPPTPRPINDSISLVQDSVFKIRIVGDREVMQLLSIDTTSVARINESVPRFLNSNDMSLFTTTDSLGFRIIESTGVASIDDSEPVVPFTLNLQNSNLPVEELKGERIRVYQTNAITGKIIGAITFVLDTEDSVTNTQAEARQNHIDGWSLSENGCKIKLDFATGVENGKVSVSSAGTSNVESVHKMLEDGDTESEVDIPANSSGLIIIDLIENNVIVDTKKMYK